MRRLNESDLQWLRELVTAEEGKSDETDARHDRILRVLDSWIRSRVGYRGIVAATSCRIPPKRGA